MKRRFELEPGEAILEEWVAGIPSAGGRTALYGGTLVLTTGRLIWEAIRLPVGLDRVVGALLAQALMQGIPLGQVTGVRPDDRRGHTLHIQSAAGEMSLLVSASRFSPIWSKKNVTARDAAVARLAAVVGR